MANVMNIQYGSKIYQLPKSLIINEDFVKEIVSANVWNNKLRKSDKMNLLKFLPDFPNNDTYEKKETLKKLFLGKHINFENQIKTFVRLAKDGDFNSSIKCQKALDLLLAERNRKINLFKRRLNDLKKIVNTKKSLSMEISEEEEKCLKDFQYILDADDPLSEVVEARFNKIMRKITCDPDEYKKSEICAEFVANAANIDYKSMLLCDVINRCQNESDSIQDHQLESVGVVNSNGLGGGPMTRKRRQLQNGYSNSLSKYAKFSESISDSQSDSSDDNRMSNDDNSDNESITSDTDSVGSGLAQSANQKPARLNRHERREFRCPQDDFTDFFSLLQRLFVGAHQQKLTTHQIEDRIRHWHIVHKRNIGDSFNRWAVLSIDWVGLAVPALTYLSHNELSILEHRKKSQTWRWKTEVDCHVLRRLFNDWHQISQGTNSGANRANQSVGIECEQIAPPLFQTDWKVRQSTAEERMRFQMQERKRFIRPWRGFLYNVHGYNCAVAPIRGCLPGRDYSNVKARGHPLLVNDRPPHVNIVEIVRDAVARLPNGEGSRADIVSLAMDSAFWSNTSGPGSEKSISQCISSALDRLQGEGCDPSVKYNARLKLWFYRHRNKSLEELEQAVHIQHQQDDMKRYHRNSTSSNAGPSNGSGHGHRSQPSSGTTITMAGSQQQQSGSLVYGQILLSSNTGYQHGSVSRYGQVQFSQAVNHARDLTLQQPIYISRPLSSANSGLLYNQHSQQLFPSSTNHSLSSSAVPRIITPVPSQQRHHDDLPLPEFYANHNHHYQQQQQQNFY